MRRCAIPSHDLGDACAHALVDYVLHPVLQEASAAAMAEISELAGLGHRTLKAFMMTPDFDAQADLYVAAIELAIQELRSGSDFPDWLLERRRRAEDALVLIVATSYCSV